MRRSSGAVPTARRSADRDPPAGGAASRWVAPVAVALVGMLLAVLVPWMSHARNVERGTANARSQALSTAAAFAQKVNTAVAVVNSTRGLFAAYGNVTEGGYHEFAIRALRDRPYIFALQYSQVVTAAQRRAFEEALAARGYGGGITEQSAGRLVPAPARDRYIAIELQEPSQGNESVFGLDITSRPDAAAVIARAVRTDSTQMGSPINLVQNDQRAALIYAPVYRRGAPIASAAERERALVGVVGAVFLYERALASLPSDPSVEVVVTEQAAAQPLWTSSGVTEADAAYARSWPAAETVEVGGWTVAVYTRPTGDGVESAVGLATGALIAALTALLVAYVWRSAEHRRVQALAGELSAANADLVFRNSHDVLTGLLTRDRAAEVLSHWVANPNTRQISALFVDLDMFGGVNATWGHSEGDHVLRQVGWQLARICDENTVVARIGGDAFLVLRRTQDGMADDVADLVARVRAAVAEPVVVGVTQQSFACSIGIACYPRDARGGEQLIANADAAVRAAKARGRGLTVVFDQAVAAVEEERAAMERELGLDLRDPGAHFSLVYQPQVDMVSGAVVGIEALARMTDGRWMPSKFIPAVEAAGKISILGRWVLDSALRQVAEWRESGITVPPVSVNVSSRQLTETPLDSLAAEILASHGLPPSALRLEVTESAIMAEGSAEVLARTRDSGVPLSIDDFGTGYSSLSRLATLAVDDLKIDASFVEMLPNDQDAFEVVRFVADLGRVYGLTVVAEGVETKEQAEVLLDAGVRIAQGYLYSPPLGPGATAAYLRSARVLGQASVG